MAISVTTMADKRTKEEILEEIRQEDATKDVPINSAVAIAVLSGVASVAGTVACLSIGFLEIYRQDVIAFWMACIPFCFPFITGISIAYRKKLSCVGVHVSLLLATLLTGGAGYGYSIEPVFINRKNCKIVSEDRGNCDKETLLYLYITNGGIALGFTVIGLIYSLLICRCATKRRHNREVNEHMEHEKTAELQKRASRRSHEKVTYVPAWPGTYVAHPQATAATKTEASNGDLNAAKRLSSDQPQVDPKVDSGQPIPNKEQPSNKDNQTSEPKTGDATTHL
ncbi:hypothetical protein Bpfe_012738 [Biomphalaria pfeifferi]|uniref:Uncharacterized protein n=1 Tax=Biomphalaria pfeifferi TaxID=112525 RepID=A0AAD8FAI4_BIOPF|nr:hypothetical protein Bpfe_012738 [Biomphalaria pfeifferi]